MNGQNREDSACSGSQLGDVALINMMAILPLATPKHEEVKKCMLCPISGRIFCRSCRVACYCSPEHLQADTIHPMVCKDLTFLGRGLPFHPTAEGREREKLHFRKLKEKLAFRLRDIAFELQIKHDDNRHAKLASKYGANLLMQELGPRHLETVDMLLMLAFYCIKLGQYTEAECYLCKMSDGLKEDSALPYTIRANLAKTKGILESARGDYGAALREHAEEVYMSTHAHGTHHILAATSYWRLGKVFQRLRQLSEANSLYQQCIEIWLAFLQQKCAEKREASKKPTAMGLVATGMCDLAVQIQLDGKEALPDISQVRLKEKVPTVWRDKVLTYYAHAMFDYLSGNHVQACDKVNLAANECNRFEDPDLAASLLDFYKLCRKQVPLDVLKRDSRELSWMVT